jgi:ribosomal-protein-alanine N-acetyltransferase
MENLVIRRFNYDDVDDMFNNWLGDKEVAKYMLYPLYKNKEEVKEKAINFFVNDTESYAIEYENEVVGSFTYNFNKKHNFVQIGFLLGTKFHNKKIMTNTLQYFLNKAKTENVNLIIAEVMEENIPSSKLLEKNGFQLDGIIRKKYKDRYGIYQNIKVYTYLINEN